MKQNSLWKKFSDDRGYPSLDKKIKVDVAVIGGGITGIGLAEMLKERGCTVAVLEGRRIGKGSTGQSTGNLYLPTDQLLHALESKYDTEKLRLLVRSRQEAMERIKSNIVRYAIDCDYETIPMYIFQKDGNEIIAGERETCSNMGVKVGTINPSGFPFKFQDGIELPDQAQFNPRLYVQKLAMEINDERHRIFEASPVMQISEEDTRVILQTPEGEVEADYAVHATHTPKGVEILFDTSLGPYREYGVAASLKDTNYPKGIFWGYDAGQKYSVRSYLRNGENHILCIGQPHKVGQSKNNVAHVDNLQDFLNKHFNIERFSHVWGGQNYKPADLIPYIGRKDRSGRQFIATGFATDGLVYGTLAALIIADEICQKENPYSAFYAANRLRPVKAVKRFIKENINVGQQLLKDPPFALKNEQSEINPGEAAVWKISGKKVAVFRSKEGAYRMLSAVCPHMGCVVRWNNLEESWDCPCHGSRFDTKGKVIEGPSFKDLEKYEDPIP